MLNSWQKKLTKELDHYTVPEIERWWKRCSNICEDVAKLKGLLTYLNGATFKIEASKTVVAEAEKIMKMLEKLKRVLLLPKLVVFLV